MYSIFCVTDQYHALSIINITLINIFSSIEVQGEDRGKEKEIVERGNCFIWEGIGLTTISRIQVQIQLFCSLKPAICYLHVAFRKAFLGKFLFKSLLYLKLCPDFSL